MVSPSFNVHALRSLDRRKRAEHFAQVLKQCETQEASREVKSLLEALVEKEAISPSILVAWLQVCGSTDPRAVVSAMTFKHSRYVRSSAIKHFCKLLHGPRWQLIWDAAGGLPGLLVIFSELSVEHVFKFSKLLAHVNSKNCNRDEEREGVMENLLCALLPTSFPGRNCQHETVDHRPLEKAYAPLLLACGRDFVQAFFTSKHAQVLQPHMNIARLATVHTDLFRQGLLDGLSSSWTWPYLGTFEQVLSLSLSQPISDRIYPNSYIDFPHQILQCMTNSDDQTCAMSVDQFGFRFLPALLYPHIVQQLTPCNIKERINTTIDIIERFQQYKTEVVLDCFLQAIVNLWQKVFKMKEISNDMLESVKASLAKVGKMYMPDRLLTKLRHMIEQYNPGSSDRTTKLISTAPQSMRYDIIQTLFASCTPKSVDITDESQLHASNIPLIWSSRIIRALRKESAAELLCCLIRAEPGAENIKFKPSEWAQSHHCDGDRVARAMDMFHGLKQDCDFSMEQARSFLELRKEMAEQATQVDCRTFFATAACRGAVSIGSLDAYCQFVKWSQRLRKYPTVLKSVYLEAKKARIDTLLAGVPSSENGSRLLADVRKDLTLSSEIMNLYLEDAKFALMEPTFSCSHWESAFEVIESSFFIRLRRLCGHYKQDQFQALIEIVLPVTMEQLLTLERFYLQPDHERLNRTFQAGPFTNSWWDHLGHVPAEIYRFLDQIAERRNELWCQVRAERWPEVSTLPLIWPRGLPLQALIPEGWIKAPEAAESMPYFMSRIEKVFAITPEEALSSPPWDVLVTNAIGDHVDDLRFAIRMRVSWACDDRERARSAVNACAKFCSEFSLPRIPLRVQWLSWRAECFNRHFPWKESWLPPSSRDLELFLSLPLTETGESTGWAPFKVESKQFPLECDHRFVNLDAIVQADHPTHTEIHMSFDRNKCEWLRSFDENKSLWCLSAPFSAAGVVKDTCILWALLFLDYRTQSSGRLISQPFPDKEDARFKPVILDDEFLASADAQPRAAPRALRLLQSLSTDVPSVLVLRLAEKFFKKHEQRTTPRHGRFDIQKFARQVLRLGSLSDRPNIFNDMISTFALSDLGSGLHRTQLLTMGHLKRLQPHQATSMISIIMDRIVEKLEKKAVDSGYQGIHAASTENPPIKTCMVHIMLRLVVKGGYLDPRITLKYLSDIVALSNDVGVLTTTIRSLLELLAVMTHDDNNVALVYEAIKKIIPRVSGPSEKVVTTEEEWLQAEAGGALPAVFDGANLAQPISEVLFDKATLLPEYHRPLYVTHILEPIMDISAAANDRWLRAFLRKESPMTRYPSSLEPRPFHKYMVLTLLENWLPYIHARYAEYEHRMALTPVAAREVADFTRSIATSMNTHDPQTSAQRIWVRTMRTWTSTFSEIKQALNAEWKPTLRSDGGVTISHLQKTVHAQIVTLLQIPKSTHHGDEKKSIAGSTVEEFVDGLIGDLEPTFDSGGDISSTWISNVRPVVQDVFNHIESLRTPEWQRNPCRHPAVLPKTFPLRLWLWIYPYFPEIKAKPQRYEIFALQVNGLIEEFLSCKAHHHLWDDVEDAVKHLPLDQYVEVALCLGGHTGSLTLSDPASTTDVMRVELAAQLLQKAVGVVDDQATRIWEMLKKWQSNSLEEIRAFASEFENTKSGISEAVMACGENALIPDH